MTPLHFPLYNLNNGIFMISIFALVCIALVIAVVLFMSSGSKKIPNEFNDKNETAEIEEKQND